MAALTWGSADFSGGFATRRSDQYQTLAYSALSGVVLLALGAALWGESFPRCGSLLWAVGAGVCGSVGLSAFYLALSLGNTPAVASSVAVIGAGMPVLFNLFLQGLPRPSIMVGILAALIGIWMVTRPASPARRITRKEALLAMLAGTFFGGFFILISRSEPEKVFTPLIVARLVMLIVAILMLIARRRALPQLQFNPIALLAGALDACGNIFFLLARQFTRLDVAVVLSSFYPVATIFLAAFLLKEKASRWQWLGTALCIVAVALISR